MPCIDSYILLIVFTSFSESDTKIQDELIKAISDDIVRTLTGVADQETKDNTADEAEVFPKVNIGISNGSGLPLINAVFMQSDSKKTREGVQIFCL